MIFPKGVKFFYRKRRKFYFRMKSDDSVAVYNDVVDLFNLYKISSDYQAKKKQK